MDEPFRLTCTVPLVIHSSGFLLCVFSMIASFFSSIHVLVKTSYSLYEF